MSKVKRLALGATISALALASASPAMATTIRSGSATGPAYSGAISTSLASSTLSFTSSLSNVTCNKATTGGSINSDGSGNTVTSASWGYGSGACQDSMAGTTAITPRLLPWSGGSVAYSTSGGKNGTLTLANMYVKAVRADGITCHFKGGGTNNSITMDLYNPDNASKPVPGNAAGQAAAVSETVVRDTTQSNSFLCPSSASMTGTYAVTGSGGAGLYVTR